MTMAQLREYREEILGIARERGITSVQVFGSVARGDARPDSDVDFLVEVEPDRNIMAVSGFLAEMEDLLGRQVHVVSASGLRGRFGAHVRAEATPL
jgi:uncharacterized protein